jgi:hypothetical protein
MLPIRMIIQLQIRNRVTPGFALSLVSQLRPSELQCFCLAAHPLRRPIKHIFFAGLLTTCYPKRWLSLSFAKTIASLGVSGLWFLESVWDETHALRFCPSLLWDSPRVCFFDGIVGTLKNCVGPQKWRHFLLSDPPLLI